MIDLLLPVAALGGLGLVFGGLLGVAAKAFYVKKDERAEQIVQLLPGANCGGCGFAGCSAMASALAEGRAMPSSCAVLKAEQLQAISELMGLETASVEKRVAKVLCSGTCSQAAVKYEYDGIRDCVAAYRYGGGEKACLYGCSGYGSCVRACKFGAIQVVDGVAQADPEKCVGCGSCVSVCPKRLIELVPVTQRTFVKCRSREKGAVIKDICKAGCIGCKICEKNCPTGAVTVTDNIASIQYDICTNCGLCAEKCPKKVIEFKQAM